MHRPSHFGCSRLIPFTKEALLGELGYLMMGHGRQMNDRNTDKLLSRSTNYGGLDRDQAAKMYAGLKQRAMSMNTHIDVRPVIAGSFNPGSGITVRPRSHPSILAHELGHAEQYRHLGNRGYRMATGPEGAVGLRSLALEADASRRGAGMVKSIAKQEGIALPRGFNRSVLGPAWKSYLGASVFNGGKRLYDLSDRFSQAVFQRPTRAADNIKRLRSILAKIV